MPIHDWTRVNPGIFHDFHHAWIEELKRTLNRGLLPSPYYALAEQIAGGLGPDLLTLKGPTTDPAPGEPAGVLALAAAPPKTYYRSQAETESYAARAKAVVIRHTSAHQVIAVVEIVSPGNKDSRHGLRAFVGKAEELLRGGVHLLLIDLFSPGPRDPQGIPKAVWDEVVDNDFVLPSERPLSVGAFVGGLVPEVFIEPTAVGGALPDMPLFLTRNNYVMVPLNATYEAAWEAVPAFWRDVLTAEEVP